MAPRLPPLLRDVAQSVAVVAVVGLLLLSVSGVWPPMVAVESGSMEPHLQKGDLVFVTAPDRWTASADDGESGIVTVRESSHDGTTHRRLGAPGDVVVYTFPGNDGSPIIHRAHLRVERGENWYDEANASYLPPGVNDCGDLRYCPAPYGGYVTKGDASTNPYYDQTVGIAPLVKGKWVRARAIVSVPDLGWIRLTAERAL